MEPGGKVRYIGCSEDQVHWGSNVHPDLYLTKGEAYRVARVEVHTWHTKVWVDGPLGMCGPFNSVCFEAVK